MFLKVLKTDGAEHTQSLKVLFCLTEVTVFRAGAAILLTHQAPRKESNSITLYIEGKGTEEYYRKHRGYQKPMLVSWWGNYWEGGGVQPVISSLFSSWPQTCWASFLLTYQKMERNRLPWLPRFIFSPGNAWSILTIFQVTKHCVGKFWEMRTSRSGPGLSVLSTTLILTALPLRRGISSVFPLKPASKKGRKHALHLLNTMPQTPQTSSKCLLLIMKKVLTYTKLKW